MTEYIKKESLLQLAKELQGDSAFGAPRIVREIERTPAEDVVEVRHGEWKYNRGQAPSEKAYFCSLCAYGESDYGRDKYCPNCGAKMDGERRTDNE